MTFPPSNNEPAVNAGDMAAKDAALQKLINASRILGESRMIRTDSDPSQITPEEVQQVIDAVKKYLKERSVSQATLAKGLCVSQSVVSQILKATYKADGRPIIMAMDRWLARRVEADAQPQISRFVETEVAQRCRVAAKRAIAAADAGIDCRISLVHGAAGCGKTLALEAIAEAEDGIRITCGVDVMSGRALIEAIAIAINCGVAISTRVTYAAVKERLRGSGKLIIVDEIHALLQAKDDSAFHMLRRLSDETGCPQLWAATCDLVEQLRKLEDRREPLGQIVRRIGSNFNLTEKLKGGSLGGGRPEPLFTVDQILQMFASNELKLTRDAGKFLANICRNPKSGLLGTCTGLVMHATHMNRISGAKQITPHMLWEASMFLFSGGMLEALKISVGDDLKEMKLKLATA